MSLFFYLFTFALWHRKFVIADVTAVSINNQHGIQHRGQDFDKKFVFEGVHSKQWWLGLRACIKAKGRHFKHLL